MWKIFCLVAQRPHLLCPRCRLLNTHTYIHIDAVESRLSPNEMASSHILFKDKFSRILNGIRELFNSRVYVFEFHLEN